MWNFFNGSYLDAYLILDKEPQSSIPMNKMLFFFFLGDLILQLISLMNGDTRGQVNMLKTSNWISYHEYGGTKTNGRNKMLPINRTKRRWLFLVVEWDKTSQKYWIMWPNIYYYSSPSFMPRFCKGTVGSKTCICVARLTRGVWPSLLWPSLTIHQTSYLDCNVSIHEH